MIFFVHECNDVNATSLIILLQKKQNSCSCGNVLPLLKIIYNQTNQTVMLYEYNKTLEDTAKSLCIT